MSLRSCLSSRAAPQPALQRCCTPPARFPSVQSRQGGPDPFPPPPKTCVIAQPNVLLQRCRQYGTDPPDGVDPVEVGADAGVDAGRAGGPAALAPADDAHHLPVAARVLQGPAAVPLPRKPI